MEPDKMSLLRAWKTSADELIGKKKCDPMPRVT